MIEIIIFVEHISAELVCCRKMIMLQGVHGGDTLPDMLKLLCDLDLQNLHNQLRFQSTLQFRINHDV